MAGEGSETESWKRLIGLSERLAAARSMVEVIEAVRRTARDVVGADGIAVVLREDDVCFYAAEDAIAPLWQGHRFPAESCVSGWAMMRGEVAVIPDIRRDARVPQDAYAATFVRSMAMVPVGLPAPVAAIGAYWREPGTPPDDKLARLGAIARLAGTAIHNAQLLDQIEEARRQQQIALAAGRMGVWTLDLASETLTTSATCRSNFGRDPALDFPYPALRDAIHPDDKPRVFAAIAESIATGGDYDIEYRLLTPGGEERWIGIRAQPAYGEDGTPLTLSGVSVDVTEQKRMEARLRDLALTLESRVEQRTAELVAAQEALRQSQKIEAIGQLTGGVAHDFNNLLTPIIGSLDLLTRRAAPGSRDQRLTESALQAANRAKILVHRLLAFARRQPLSPAAIDLTALVIDMSPLIGTTLGPKVELSLAIDEDVPFAMADHNQVEMAILNLAVNARDAMPDGGRVTIGVRRETVAPGRADDLAPGDYVLLSVTDTGTGMDAATRERAIEPFFSTKGIGKGTGLGLSMVHGLALQLGGALTLTSSPGVGTAVEIWLPLSDTDLVAEIRPDATAAVLAPCKALLVDDEPLVRSATAFMLAELGFAVIEAESGEEALAALQVQADVELLVTDHLMPAMSGTELARRAARLRPGLRTLIVSGYADIAEIAADLPRLQKPFVQADLAHAIGALG